MKPNYEKTSILQFKLTYLGWMDAHVEIPPSSFTKDLNQKNIMQSVTNLTSFWKDQINRGNSCGRKIPTSFPISKWFGIFVTGIWFRAYHHISFFWNVVINLSVSIQFASLVNHNPPFAGTLVDILCLISLYPFLTQQGHGVARPVLLAKDSVQATTPLSWWTRMTQLHWKVLNRHHLFWNRNSPSWERVQWQMSLSEKLLNLSYWVLRTQRSGWVILLQ